MKKNKTIKPLRKNTFDTFIGRPKALPKFWHEGKLMLKFEHDQIVKLAPEAIAKNRETDAKLAAEKQVRKDTKKSKALK